jgi:hypothetical protein
MTTIDKIRRSSQSIVTAVLLSTGINAAAAGENAFMLACAERDLRVVTMIEHRGSTNGVAADQLARVFFTVMARARPAPTVASPRASCSMTASRSAWCWPACGNNQAGEAAKGVHAARRTSSVSMR